MAIERSEHAVDFSEMVRSRRSVRRYQERPVSDEDLRAVLEAIRWAPSWANTQCWEVIVVKEKEQREKLAEAFPLRNPGIKALRSAPAVIVLAARRGVSGYYGGNKVTLHGDWLLFDLGLAAQNLALAAADRGMGTVILGYFDHEEVARLLGLPDEVVVGAMIPLGYPEEEPKAPARKDLGEFVWYETYGNRAARAR